MSKATLTRDEKIELIKKQLARRKNHTIRDLSSIPVWLVDNDGSHTLLNGSKVLSAIQFERHLIAEGLTSSDIITFQ